MKNKKLILLSVMSLLMVCGCNNPQPTESNSASINTSEDSSVSNSVGNTESSPNLIENQVLYVAPDVEDFNAPGTKEEPMMIQRAIALSHPGCTIYLMDGIYRYGSPIEISVNTETYPATAEKRKTLKPLNPGKVEFDFSLMAWASSNRGIKFDANYWTAEDLIVYGAGDNGIYIGGSYNVIERCITHDCGDTGIQLGRANSSQLTIDQWPSYNLIKNCTSYDNHDPLGEDSDGFACKLTTGVGNVFDGCIAYNNVDDGWDLYTKGDTGPIGPVTLINCIAFNNGVTSGKNTNGKPYGTSNSDGNGFKLGGEVIAVPHKVVNCIAYNNLACGFTDNSNPGPLWIENCTSYNNGLRDKDSNNIDMCRDENTSVNYFKNILSYSDTNIKFTDDTMKNFNSKDQYKGTVIDSIFYYGRSLLQFKGINAADYTVSGMMGSILKTDEQPFVSTEIPDEYSDFHELFRDENGDIALGDFLKVRPEFIAAAGYDSSVALGANLA